MVWFTEIFQPGVPESSAKTGEEMTQAEFNDQWAIRELPACSAGMEILKHFAEAHPEIPLYELRILSWTNKVDEVMAEEPLWRAYARHIGDCPDCNEL